MTLIALARNPVPAGAVAGLIQGYDGLPLRYARWGATTSQTRGTVVLIPGRAEFIEKYFETVADLRRRGFAVAIMDLRGQGGSTRLLANPLKGHVRNFREYDYDLTLFMKDVVAPNCPPPYLALAHSLGGHIAMRAAALGDFPFERLIVTAPMIQIAPEQIKMPYGLARGLAEMMAGIGLSGMTPPGVPMEPLWAQPFEKNELTSSRERFERATLILEAAPELAIGPPTFGWLRAAFRSCAMLAALDFPASIKIPVLFAVAGRDTIVSSRVIEDYVPKLKLGTLALIGTSKHEILQEGDEIRGRFWASFDAYVEGMRAAA